MTRRETCVDVRRRIRAELPNRFREAIHLDVKHVHGVIAVLVPAHRANGVLFPKMRFSHDDPDRLVELATAFITPHANAHGVA